MTIPKFQRAIQLVAGDQLVLNDQKDVHNVGPYQILCRVEAVGLCFSDLKLLKQFEKHARKGPVVSGIESSVLDDIPSYVPGQKRTVPGHEAFVKVVARGDKVTGHQVGKRFLVQTDYRWAPTQNSNAAFGYNFEGGLQEYVLLDQRIFTSPQGQSLMIPVDEDASHVSDSARALVEPWACVEDAYINKERTAIKQDSKMLVFAEAEIDNKLFTAFLGRFGKPASITLAGNAVDSLLLDNDNTSELIKAKTLEDLKEHYFDDVIFFGSDADLLEGIFDRIAPGGLLNIVQSGRTFGREIETAVGRVHYGRIRIIGTTSNDPAEAMENIPSNAEIRQNDTINVIGAAGPMGVMHVVRNICQGVKGIEVYAGDLDNNRLEVLTKIAAPLAQKNSVKYIPYNPKEKEPESSYDYYAIMAPVWQIVAQAVKDANDKAIINIFAGIPASVTGKIDLDSYIRKHLYFIGTSGSVLEDMKIVLSKVETGKLDTNLSVGAVCGLEGAIEGIRAVENRTISGKIICYPACKDLELVTLDQLSEKYKKVAEKLNNGLWTKEAEKQLLAEFKDSLN